MAKPRAEHKEEGGEQHERDHIAPLVFVQSRRDKLPDLIEDGRTSQEQRGDEGDFELSEERFGQAQADQRRRTWCDLLQRLGEKSEEIIGKSVSRDEGESDRAQRLDETPAQFCQMAQEWHRAVIIGHLLRLSWGSFLLFLLFLLLLRGGSDSGWRGCLRLSSVGFALGLADFFF